MNLWGAPAESRFAADADAPNTFSGRTQFYDGYSLSVTAGNVVQIGVTTPDPTHRSVTPTSLR